MKRNVNNVNLGAIIGMVPGYIKIIVEDRKACDIRNDSAKDTLRWEGLAKDMVNRKNLLRKWKMSKVYEIRPTEKGLMFVISTQYEEY